MINLPDVNVWVAAVARNHEHHAAARTWLDRQTDVLAFCRVTQMGVLRVLTTTSALRDDAVTRRKAWAIFDGWMRDSRVRFFEEPVDVESQWRALSERDDRSYHLWTDDYLAAFAQAVGATFITFDQAIQARYPSVSVFILG